MIRFSSPFTEHHFGDGELLLMFAEIGEGQSGRTENLTASSVPP